MPKKTNEQDKLWIQRCIYLSKEAVHKKDKPFGCVIVRDGENIAEASNDSERRVNHPAEIIALNKAQDIL